MKRLIAGTMFLCFLFGGCSPAGDDLSSDKAITSFVFTSPAAEGVIDEAEKTVTAAVPHGTDVTALVPTIIHTGVSVEPASGTARNFSSAVLYTVTAEDGTTQVYAVTVGAAAASAALSALTLSDGTLTPSFDAVILSYSVVVPEAVTEITVTGTPADAAAVVEYTPPQPAALEMGLNAISLVVTASGGAAQKTYDISVLRASSDATLSGLFVTADLGTIYGFGPAFDPGVTEYGVNGMGTFTITATASDENAVIRIDGEIVASGEATTSVYGYDSTYTIEVTAEDGETVMNYTITAVEFDP